MTRWTQEQVDAHVARIGRAVAHPEPALLRGKAVDAEPSWSSATSVAASTATHWQPAPYIEDKHPVLGLCRAAGVVPPEVEFRFHPERKWRFDYAWPELKLALEIEGGLWMKGGGGHSHPMHIQRDIEKYSEAAILGWRILRATTDELRNGVALDRIQRAFNHDPT